MMTPVYIALCGKPTAGKDTVARIIANRMKAAIIDDGLPLRLAAPVLFGFNPSYPFSHEGKAKEVLMPDGTTKRTVRDCLGTMCAILEEEFGEFIMPARAMELAEQTRRAEGVDVFLFPSVRRRQGHFYKSKGGFVVEVDRDVEGSRYHFDNDYARDCIDFTIDNNGTLEDLQDEVDKFMRDFQERVRQERMMKVMRSGELAL